MKIVVIGGGFIGKTHARAILKADGLELAGIADPDMEKGPALAAECGCRHYADAREMLDAERPDIADVCLPTFLHEEYVLEAADRGVHVLCEKPFALSSRACMRMTETCKRAGVKLMVAQAARYLPEFAAIREMVRSGSLGNLHMVCGSRLCQHPAWTTWHRDPEKSGGGLFDLHLHDIDYLYSLFGEIEAVNAVGWHTSEGCWNHVATTLYFKNGVCAMEEASLEMTDGYPFSVNLRLTGDRATADYQFRAGFNIEPTGDAKSELILYEVGKEPAECRMEPADSYQLEIEDFARSVKNGTPAPIAPTESVYVMHAIEAIRQSAEERRAVPVKSE